MKKYALIVAGGSGSRMNSQLPKQFIRIGAYPILMQTILQFAKLVPTPEIILVLPEKEIPAWNKLLLEYQFDIKTQIVKGGASRAESVRNGLAAIKDLESVVAIHDGVRPFISPLIISKSYEEAIQKGNAIVAVKLKDSIREVLGDENQAKNRANYRLIQTPQTFQTRLIKQAYQHPDLSSFTDDASVAEKSQIKINLIDGDYQNIKITTPEDLLVAKAFVDAIK